MLLQGIDVDTILSVLNVDKGTLDGISNAELRYDELVQLGLKTLAVEAESWVNYKSKRNKLKQAGDDKGLLELMDAHRNDNGVLVEPSPVTYSDVVEFRRTTKSVAVKTGSATLAGLRQNVISSLYQDSLGALPRRDKISILRVIGVGEDIFGNNKNNTEVTQNNDNRTYQVVFNKDKVEGSEDLTINHKGEVVGTQGDVLQNMSRSKLVEMLNSQ